MDFNAGYYSPRLGRFISPDSIVPDPTTSKGFNRYMYADGNPVKFSDPSAHIAIIFRGGYAEQGIASSSNGSSDFWDAAEQALRDAGYDPDKQGEILRLKNTQGDIETAAAAILAQEQTDSALPVILIGHSWGGAAALETAQFLDESSFPSTVDPEVLAGVTANVDLLFLIDAEYGRGRVRRNPVTFNLITDYTVQALFGNHFGIDP